MLIFKRTIHSDQYCAYFNAGWRWFELPDKFGIGVVSREFYYFGEDRILAHKGAANFIPFKIKRPLMSTVGQSLFDSVVPANCSVTKSDAEIFIRGIEAVFSLARLHRTPLARRIGNSTYSLRIYGFFDQTSSFDYYVSTVQALLSDEESVFNKFAAEADVWFDFGSKCILSFDKNYLHRADSHLRVSFKEFS
jgi:hypothetical protein